MDPDVLAAEPVEPVEVTDELQTEPAEPTAAVVPPAVEQFIDPRDLPPEIMGHFKRMQAAFTKKMQKLADDPDKKLLTQFRADPEFAKQVLAAEAKRLGVSLADASPAKAALAGPAGAVPQEFVDAVAAELPPEVRWMAPALAKATFAQVRAQTAPLLAKDQQRDQRDRQTEWDAMAAQLSDRMPGWEVHEDDMIAMLDFLQSPSLKHPVYGSKPELLLNLVTGNAAATQRAIDRMGAAGRSRTTTGQSARATVPNITERVRKAPSNADAWQQAAQAAIAIVGGAASKG